MILIWVAAIFGLLLPAAAGAASTLEEKSAMVQACTRIVADYTRFLSTGKRPPNILSLEREYTECAVVIEEYSDRFL